jgi:hypothetical protein
LDKIYKKNKLIFFEKKFEFSYYYFTKDVKLQEKPSALKKEHPALGKLEIYSLFCGSFLRSWIRIANVDADPDPVDQNTSNTYLKRFHTLCISLNSLITEALGVLKKGLV